MREHDVAVIGGGLVGLASAYRLLERSPGLRVAVLEKEDTIAVHQSGHNSGVVHAGVYYAPGSLKARLCRAGATALRQKCAEWSIPVRERGKLIVATDASELERLQELERRGRENGIKDVEVLDEDGLRRIEPHVRGVRGLHVPETAVVDFTAVARRLAEELRERGAQIRLGAAVTEIAETAAGVRLTTTAGTVDAAVLVACAGLQSDRVARLAGLSPSVRIVPFRGAYWRLTGRSAALVRGLIYPVPDPTLPFLGVHFTRGHDDAVTAGPNAVPALAREGYRPGAVSARDTADAYASRAFLRLARRYARAGAAELWRHRVKPAAVADMRRYVPDLAAGDVVRGGSGIRAQALSADGALVDDFVIEQGPSSLHVLNAPSPAATASLAIGELIAERSAEQLGSR